MKRLLIILLLGLGLLILYDKYKQSAPPPPSAHSPAGSSPSSGPARVSILPKIKQLAIEQELQVINAREEGSGWITITVVGRERHHINEFLNELTRSVTMQDFEGSQPKASAAPNGRRRFEATYRIKTRTRR